MCVCVCVCDYQTFVLFCVPQDLTFLDKAASTVCCEDSMKLICFILTHDPVRKSLVEE